MGKLIFLLAMIVVPRFAQATAYFVSTTGSDSNNGLTSGTAWLSLNHSLNGVDTITLVAGSFDSANFQTTGTVTVPGVHGFVKIGCSVTFGCVFAVTSGNNDAIRFTTSHWSLSGMRISNTSASNSNGNCVEAFPASSAASIYDIIVQNNVIGPCGGGGVAFRDTSPAGVDYGAVLGNVIFSVGPTNTFGTAGISAASLVKHDSSTGTHFYACGNFVWGATNPGGNFDGEGIIFESMQVHSYDQQMVACNNIVVSNGGIGMYAELNMAAPVYFLNNTTWHNSFGSFMAGFTRGGEFVFFSTVNSSATGNIAEANTVGIGGCCNPAPPFQVDTSDSTSSVLTNILYSAGGTAPQIISSPSFTYGVNSLSNPSLAAPATPGTPNCTGQTTTTACMASVIATFATSNPLGYKTPGPTPIVDPFFPQWLCPAGLVVPGIITMGCNVKIQINNLHINNLKMSQ